MRIGLLLVAVAMLHIVLALALHHAELAQIVAQGSVDVLREPGERAFALWLLIGGAAICALGLCAAGNERHGLPLPRPVRLGLVALAAAVLLPMHSALTCSLLPVACLAVGRAPRLTGFAKRWCTPDGWLQRSHRG